MNYIPFSLQEFHLLRQCFHFFLFLAFNRCDFLAPVFFLLRGSLFPLSINIGISSNPLINPVQAIILISDLEAMGKKYPDFDIIIEEVTDEEGELLVWEGHEQ